MSLGSHCHSANRWWPISLLAGGGLLGLSQVVFAGLDKPLLVVAAPLGAAAAILIVRTPFLGLVGVVLLTQLDYFFLQLLKGFPLTPIEILTALMLAGIVLDGRRKRRPGPRDFSSLPLRLAFMFWLVVLLSFLFADNRYFALVTARGFSRGILLFFLVLHLTTTRRQVKALILAFLVATGLSASLSVGKYAFGIGWAKSRPTQAGAGESGYVGKSRAGGRLAGGAKASAQMSSYLMFAGASCATILALRRRRWRAISVLAAVAGTTGALLSFTRSIAPIFLLAFSWLLAKFRRHRRFPVILALASALLLAALPLVPANFWQRLATLAEPAEDLTLGRRVGHHLIGLDLLLSRPLLGVGPGNYKARHTDFEYRLMPGRYRLEPRALHNMYLEVAVEEGILGFACFAGILWLAVVGLHRTRMHAADGELRVLAEALHFTLVLYLFCCLLVPAELKKATWILPALSIAVARLGESSSRSSNGDDGLGSRSSDGR